VFAKKKVQLCLELAALETKFEQVQLRKTLIVTHSQVGSKLVKQWNCLELGAHSQLSALKGVEGRVDAPGWD